MAELKLGSTHEHDLSGRLVAAVWAEVKAAESQGFTIEDFHDPDYRHHVGGELWARFRFLLREAGVPLDD